MRRSTRPFASLLLTTLLLAASTAFAAGPRLVRVPLGGTVTMRAVLEAGLDVVGVRGGAVEVLEWPGDDATLARIGAAPAVLDADPGHTAAVRARAELAAQPRRAGTRVWSATRPDGAFRVEDLPPAGFGSLGGYWTLAEIKMKLDLMVASDTRGLVADKLDTLGVSLHGRPIWGLQLGKAVAGPDTRPLAFFNSLTHAREPGGMQALFAFADMLLARYDTDPEVRYVLDQRRVYLVPCVNPDGYRFNQSIWDSTGNFGLWRKNLRDNNSNGVTGAGDGVDLNRNFGFRWGWNNTGSSNIAGNETYRGPSANSEPETRVQRDAVIARRPVTGLSYHTYSDLLVHPWGWTAAGTPDSLKFQTWTDELTRDNGFTGGPGPRILYETNGDFNDFMYGDTLLKPKAFSWTPEMGGPDDGFWPPPSRMDTISASTWRTALYVAGIAGPWVKIERTSLAEGFLAAGGIAHLSVRARNLGASGTAGPSLQATLTALDHEVEALSGPVFYPDLGSLQSADASGGATFLVAAVDTITPGRMVRFRVDFTDGSGLHTRDTVEVVVGVPTVKLLSACSNLVGWNVTGAGWATRANDPEHPSTYFTDSPGGVYAGSMNTTLALSAPLDLSAGTHAWLFFEDRWGYESDYDGGVIEASLDGSVWTALMGNGSTLSDPNDVLGAGVPSFEGTRWRWRADRMDLSAFAGGPAAGAVRLRLRSRSDSFTSLDGLSVDSIRVYLYDPAAQPAPVSVGPAPHAGVFALAPPSPNPARDGARFEFALPGSGAVALEVFDVQGRLAHAQRAQVSTPAGGARFAWGWNLRDAGGQRVAPGLYLVRLRTGSHEARQRLVVLP